MDATPQSGFLAAFYHRLTGSVLPHRVQAYDGDRLARGDDDPCLSSTHQNRTVVMKQDSDTVASALDVAFPIAPVLALQTREFSIGLSRVLQEQTWAVSLG